MKANTLTVSGHEKPIQWETEWNWINLQTAYSNAISKTWNEY
jgi:hypothetical protein